MIEHLLHARHSMIAMSFSSYVKLMRLCIIWDMWVAVQSTPKSQCLFPYLQAVILKPSDSRLLQASISTISTLSLHFLHWVICMQLTNQWRKNVDSSWDISGAKTQYWHTPFLLTYHWPELAIASVWFKGSWEVESTCTSTGNESVWKTHGILSATLKHCYYSQCTVEKDKMTCSW